MKLSQRSVSPAVIRQAQLDLRKFVKDFQWLYTLRNMLFNIHQTLHLAEKCEQGGPLWCFDLYAFESLNGILKKMAHGTQVRLAISSIFLMLKDFFILKYFAANGRSTCQRLQAVASSWSGHPAEPWTTSNRLYDPWCWFTSISYGFSLSYPSVYLKCIKH